MTVLDAYVLIEQTMKKKKSAIITDAAKDEKQRFDFSFKIVQVGPKCERPIKVGDSPIFSQYAQFTGYKELEKTNDMMRSLIIVHENDIVGIDNDEEEVVKLN